MILASAGLRGGILEEILQIMIVVDVEGEVGRTTFERGTVPSVLLEVKRYAELILSAFSPV
jgi:hypothetical protein